LVHVEEDLMKRIWVMAALCAVSSACADRVIVVMPAPTETKPQPTSTKPAPDQVAGEDDWGIRGNPPQSEDYGRVVDKVAAMVSDSTVTQGASRRKLDVVNVMWEDTGRAEGSSLGPNISDLTLQVRRRDAQGRFVSALMPVIRFPNFTDRTGDIPSDKFFVRVGNEKARGGSLQSVLLTDVLRDLKAFITVPDSIRGTGNLLAARDTHFLVSAQAVFLPIPKEGKAEFNPVIFNYQSAPDSPAVLTILITREGSSVNVIENRSEDLSPSGTGQELYFNNKGQRTSFTAERRSDVQARIEAQGGPKTEADRSALAKGADVLFLVQVPLVHANRGTLGGAMGEGAAMSAAAPMAPAKKGAMKPSAKAAEAEEKSDVEQAVLGHGPNLGPYSEGRGLRLVRDTKFPIRITVQFYKATSNGVVSESDLDGIARSIGSVYEHADVVGSLVMPDGDPRRPTAWQKVPGEWFPW
jgi:hypothetical protein